ncbi:calpastatin isoform X4 [Lissotriton helveticus]
MSSRPNKGKRRPSGAGKGSKEHGDKKASGATPAADQKAPGATEKKPTSPTSPKSPTSPASPTSPGTSQPPGAQASGAGAAAKKQPAAAAPVTKESTMKPAEAKGGLFSKTEPAKTAPSSKPADPPTKTQKDQGAPKSPTKASGTAVPPKQPSAAKTAPSQDAKTNQTKQKEPKVTGEKASGAARKPGAESKTEKPSVAATTSKPAADIKGAKASAASSKPAAEIKSEKKPVSSGVAVAAVGAAGAVGAAAAVSSKASIEAKDAKKPVPADASSAAGIDSALDELMGTLEGPEVVPESPKYTGPVITEQATSTKIKKLGEDDSTIPPEYRHLLDGKDSSGTPIKPEETPMTPMGDEDLVSALSSDFTCASSPDKKKQKLEEAKPEECGIDNSALDDLMGTLEGPEVNIPKTPEYTGPEITETVTAESLDPLGIRDSTIPPAYRHLLDGKDNGKPLPPPTPETPTTMSDADLADAFSVDFGSSSYTSVQPALPGPTETMSDADLADAFSMDFVSSPYDRVKPALPGQIEQSLGEEDLVSALSTDFTCSAPTDAKKEKPDEGKIDDSALDELMGTLEGPEENIPESPVYTGPIVTEANTATHIEELGKREGSIPPKYRHLLDGKDGGKVVPPPKADTVKPMSDAELADELSKDFACTASPTAKPTAPAKPTDTVDKKTPKVASSEEVTTCAKASAVQSAAAPSKTAAAGTPPSKAPVSSDPLDALSATLGAGDPKPTEKKPAVDKVKEKTGKEHIDKLGEREDTIPPEYRLEELKDKDGKPKIPKPEPKPKPLSDTELADALSGDFVTSTATTTQSAPLPAAKKAPVSSDPLDALSATLGAGDPKPTETKPAVDKVKEKTGKEHIDKLGEREDTIPPEYRLEELKDKDGKPIIPKPEPKPKPLSDTELVDALSGDFVTSTATTTQSAPLPAAKDTAKSKGSPSKEVAPRCAASTVKKPAPAPAQKDQASADPLDTLAGTLPKGDPSPKDSKPPVDKVKEKTKQEKGEKLGEREDTINPEYRLTEVKDKDGKPMLPKPEAKPKAMSDDELLDALSGDFVTSPSAKQSAPLSSAKKDDKKSVSAEEIVSCSSASAVHAGAPAPADSDVQIPDDAFDLLSDTLGTREPDPEENKPMVDKVKEKATKEHIDKLGERDDTIPPEYRELLSGKDKPVTPAIPEKPKIPQDDTKAIDALSEGFCSSPSPAPPSQPAKDKSSKDSAPSKPASKDEGKGKDSAKDKVGKDITTTKSATTDEVKVKGPEKTKEQSSSAKKVTDKTCKS